MEGKCCIECNQKKPICKGLCRTCYQRKYQREKYGSKEFIPIDKDLLYNSVLKFVKDGYTILDAIKKAGHNSSGTFYRLISPYQKAELLACKRLRDINESDTDFSE